MEEIYLFCCVSSILIVMVMLILTNRPPNETDRKLSELDAQLRRERK